MTNLYLAHHGVPGQRWGVRKYQNEDGSLTPEGKLRYYVYGDRFPGKPSRESKVSRITGAVGGTLAVGAMAIKGVSMAAIAGLLISSPEVRKTAVKGCKAAMACLDSLSQTGKYSKP